MAHLTREELDRWWREGRSRDRERVVGHLGECDECGALYGQVIDEQPAPADLAAWVPPDLAAGYRAYRRQRRTPVLLSPRMLAAGAAASLLLVIFAPALRERTRPPVQESTAIRGTSLQPLAPIGAARPPVQFRWASPVDAHRFSVEIRDDERRLLMVLSSQRDEVDLPAERLSDLVPNRTYHWQAVALDAGGVEIMRTPSRAFVLSASR